MSTTNELIVFVYNWREQLGLTQQELTNRAGGGLWFVRDLDALKRFNNDDQSTTDIIIDEHEDYLSAHKAVITPTHP